jgi:hypothetical protein
MSFPAAGVGAGDGVAVGVGVGVGAPPWATSRTIRWLIENSCAVPGKHFEMVSVSCTKIGYQGRNNGQE